jgi:hypothetical protein
MRRSVAWASASALAASIVCWIQSPVDAAPRSTAAAIVNQLAARLADVANYRADLEIHLRMRHFPFLGAVFHGSTTYQAPGTFSVSLRQHALAQNYQRALTEMGNPEAWLESYNVSVDQSFAGQPGELALRLVPRRPNDVDHIVAIVDQASRTIQRIDWSYRNGGHVSMTQRYAPVDGLLMITHQDIDIATPRADVSAQADLRNYSIGRLLGRTSSAFAPGGR